MKYAVSVVLAIFATLTAIDLRAGQVDEALKALQRNERAEARRMLEAALEGSEATEAAHYLMLLNILEWKTGSVRYMKKIVEKEENYSPYLYTLWFEEAVTGGYGRKSDEHLSFMNSFMNRGETHPNLVPAGQYLLGLNYLFNQNFPKARAEWQKPGSLRTHWQFAGTFDNTSGSGFDKDYGPPGNPRADAVFRNKADAEVRWFTPAHFQADPWVTTKDYMGTGAAVIYAQTFANSPSDKDLVFALGYSGSLKVWVNDELVYADPLEYKTEIDVFEFPVKFKSGTNRILIQLGNSEKISYPNYCLRVKNPDGSLAQGLTYSAAYQNYPSLGGENIAPLKPHFAEAYFMEKWKAEPDNVLYAIHLAKAHYRKHENHEAVEVLNKALELNPDNALLLFELVLNFIDLSNRTDLLESLEKLRKVCPDLPFIVSYDLETALDNEDIGKSTELLEQFGSLVSADYDEYIEYNTRLLLLKKEYQQLIEEVDRGYALHPTSSYFVRLKYSFDKQISGNPEKSLTILKNHVKKIYDHEAITLLLNEYRQLGKNKEEEALHLDLVAKFPEETDQISSVLGYYWYRKDYANARKYGEMITTINPYHSGAWSDLMYINDAMGDNAGAIKCGKKAVHYNPNSFSTREKLRTLEGKSPLLEELKFKEADARISEASRSEFSSDDSYSYLFKVKKIVVFPEGSSLKYECLGIRIQNESGIDDWKESKFNVFRDQNLIIDRAEIRKKNGSTIKAEQYQGTVVCPNLEVGDVVFFEFRVENFSYGKLAKEFWLDHVFSSYVPVDYSLFKVYMPEGREIYVEGLNLSDEPVKSKFENNNTYTWEMRNVPKVKDEKMMPPLFEVGKAVSLSTVENWGVIADWYRDLAMPRVKNSYNLNEVFAVIFPSGTEGMSDTEKAEAIYYFIQQNIKYSSVSFRQSNFVPQEPMVTLSSNLGDCKDVSTLYYALAEKAGLESNLVLVSTRDNGEFSLVAPNVGFNHCIIRIEVDGEPLYQELTDNTLPFGAMPSSLQNAQALVIPSLNESGAQNELIRIPIENRKKNYFKRNSEIKVSADGFDISTSVRINADISSAYRSNLKGLTENETRESIIDLLNDYLKGSFELKTYNINHLDNMKEDLVIEASVNQDVNFVSIGDKTAFQVPLFEVIFTNDAFPSVTREHPLLYWDYENCDYFENTTTVELANGKSFAALPKNFTVKNNLIDYSLEFQKISANKVKITRRVNTNRKVIQASEYESLRSLVKDIVKAEESYLTF